MEFFGFAVLVVGLIAASVLHRHLRESKQLQLRQILHEERIKAMERDLPRPDAHDENLSALLARPGLPEPGGRRGLEAGVLWIRLVALCLGLTLLAGGVGTTLGLLGVGDPEAQGMWSIGLIPVFIGLGLLVFYRLSRGFVGPAVRQSPE